MHFAIGKSPVRLLPVQEVAVVMPAKTVSIVNTVQKTEVPVASVNDFH
jgi:hypothetical protein